MRSRNGAPARMFRIPFPDHSHDGRQAQQRKFEIIGPHRCFSRHSARQFLYESCLFMRDRLKMGEIAHKKRNLP
jgi:hypothetical protein